MMPQLKIATRWRKANSNGCKATRPWNSRARQHGQHWHNTKQYTVVKSNRSTLNPTNPHDLLFISSLDMKTIFHGHMH